jgi:hypothetical protein
VRYAFAALLCVTSVLFIAFAVSAGTLVGVLLGLSGIVASAGIVIRDHETLRYVCATLLLANAVMIALSVTLPGVTLSWALAALSFAAGIGLVLRQEWVRIPTVITSVMTLGGWIAAALTSAIAHQWPEADVGPGLISLMPGLVLGAIWVWCPLTVARLCMPSTTPV